MTDTFKKTTKIIASLSVLLLFLYLLFRNVDLAKVKEAFIYADWKIIVLSLVFIPVSLYVRAWRWKYLLCDYRNVRLADLFEVTCVSRALANVLPFRAADVVQAVHLGEKEKISKVAVLASVASERVIDLLFLLLFFAGLSFFVFIPGNVKVFVFIALCGVLGLFMLLIKNVDRLEKLLSKLSPGLGDRVKMIKEGIKVFSNGRLFALASMLTLLNWGGTFAATGLLFYAFGLPFSPVIIIAYMVLPAIVTIVPSSPGFIGVWDFFAVATLTSYQIDKSLALGVTTVAHLIALIGPSVFGLYYFVRNNLLKSGGKQTVEGI